MKRFQLSLWVCLVVCFGFSTYAPQTVAYRIQQALKLLRVSLKDYLPMLVWLVG